MLVKHIQLASYSKLQFLTQVTQPLILANEVSGNVNDFTDLMNKKAKALGMSNTHFVNPTGAENKQLKEFAPSKYKNQDNTTSTAKDFCNSRSPCHQRDS